MVPDAPIEYAEDALIGVEDEDDSLFHVDGKFVSIFLQIFSSSPLSPPEGFPSPEERSPPRAHPAPPGRLASSRPRSRYFPPPARPPPAGPVR